MLNKVLKKLSNELVATEQGQLELRKYLEMQKTPGWKVYQTLVVTVANELAKYLISKDFTEQDAVAKDREQWGIYHFRSFMDFLLDPVEVSKTARLIKIHNQKMEETARPGSTTKGRK